MTQFVLLAILLGVALVAMWVPPSEVDDARGSSPEVASEAEGDTEWSLVRAIGTPARFRGILAFTLTAVAVAGFALTWGGSPDPRQPRLAVLPFQTVGDQDEFVAVGITEEITTRLGSLEGIEVVSSSATRELARGGASLGAVSEELGIDFALEGSVTLEGDGGQRRILVRARLIDPATASQVWGEIYEEPAASVFEVEGRIAERVARAMNVVVGEDERLVLSAASTGSFDAYQAYLDGIGHRRLIRDPEHAWGALESFRRAIDLDPDFAAARAGYASAHLWLALIHGYGGHLDSARVQVAAAEALSPLDPDVRMVRALTTSMVEVDLEGALEEYQALERVIDDRRRSITRGFIGELNWRLGQPVEAIQWGREALELDEFLPTLLVSTANRLLRTGEFAEAAAMVARAHAVRSGDPRIPLLTVLIPLSARGDADAAWAEMEKLGDPAPIGLVFGAGLDGSSRAVTRILADRLEVDEVLRGLPSGSDAFRAGGFLAAGLAARAKGGPQAGIAYLEQALEILDALIREEAELAPHLRVQVRGASAVALAALGRHEEASQLLRESELLLPHPTDVIMREDIDVAYAEALAMGGDLEGARERLRRLLQGPTWVTDGLLLADPLWGPLRESVRSP